MSTTTALQNKVIEAACLGTLAFQRGAARVPGADKGLGVLIRGLSFRDAATVMSAWLASWDAANAAA